MIIGIVEIASLSTNSEYVTETYQRPCIYLGVDSSGYFIFNTSKPQWFYKVYQSNKQLFFCL